jgi:hypothetical protein
MPGPVFLSGERVDELRYSLLADEWAEHGRPT